MIGRILKRRRERLSPPSPTRAEATKQVVGQYGEEQAVVFLEKLGYKILERNCKVGGHEVDIIARDGAFAVFCEVKTRTLTPVSAQRFGRPALSVSKEQRRNLAKAARAYLYRHRDLRGRFDIIEVYLDPTGTALATEKIVHLKDAFRP